MAAYLDHLLVPAKDRVAAAKLLGTLLGVPWAEQGAVGPFSPVYVNEGLTIDFDQWPEPVPKQHYCFRVNQAEFDAIFARIKAAGLAYRSLPLGPDDFKVNHAFGGSLIYWSEPDGHAWELLTVSYERQGDSRKGDSDASPEPTPNSMARVVAAILDYVEQNPDAADTVDGIGRWWSGPHDSASRDDVLHALEKLVAEGRLIKRVSPDGRCLFCKRHVA
jgi:catechol 2,3-dioxygenase-like lactoylglutathione lyase family enzyme